MYQFSPRVIIIVSLLTFAALALTFLALGEKHSSGVSNYAGESL